jgi:predicted aldo/keto reductase-like oxidoreductase
MERRTLGRTGLKVTVLGLGGNGIERPTTPEAVNVINHALDRGVNYLDTARIYTDSEEKIGNILKTRRDECYVSSKTRSRTRREALQDIKVSLKTLQTDHIDLLQLHNVRDEQVLKQVLSPDGAYQALLEAKKKGWIDHIGVTGHNRRLLTKAIKTEKFETVQVPFNFVETETAEELIPTAGKLDVGVIIMKPLVGGATTYPREALRFILQHKVTTTIPGMATIGEVDDNVEACTNLTPLTRDEMRLLKAEAEILGKRHCHRCGDCLPCPVGIDIPQTFIQSDTIKHHRLYPQQQRARYKDFAPKASECNRCGECEKRCPYGLPVVDMMAEAKRILEGP